MNLRLNNSIKFFSKENVESHHFNIIYKVRNITAYDSKHNSQHKTNLDEIDKIKPVF